MKRNVAVNNQTKTCLFEMLKRERAFWSYDISSLHADDIADEQLIALTMRYLDLPEIDMLFEIFSFQRIKKAWMTLLVPQGEYLYSINRFFAWYYFKAKNPDAYVKSLMTRQLNRIFS